MIFLEDKNDAFLFLPILWTIEHSLYEYHLSYRGDSWKSRARTTGDHDLPVTSRRTRLSDIMTWSEVDGSGPSIGLARPAVHGAAQPAHQPDRTVSHWDSRIGANGDVKPGGQAHGLGWREVPTTATLSHWCVRGCEITGNVRSSPRRSRHTNACSHWMLINRHGL